METLEALKKRRACRNFKPDMVPDQLLEQIIEAGTYAPTGMGKQSPKIIAVTNKEVRDELSALNAAVFGRDMDPFYGAPVILVVLADPQIFTYIEDGSLVLGNLMNAAADLGVDSIWIHRAREVFATERGKELLAEWGVDTNLVGIGHCALGYAAAELPAAAPRKADYVTWVR